MRIPAGKVITTLQALPAEGIRRRQTLEATPGSIQIRQGVTVPTAPHQDHTPLREILHLHAHQVPVTLLPHAHPHPRQTPEATQAAAEAAAEGDNPALKIFLLRINKLNPN